MAITSIALAAAIACGVGCNAILGNDAHELAGSMSDAAGAADASTADVRASAPEAGNAGCTPCVLGSVTLGACCVQ